MPIYFCPENVVCLICLLYILKCSLEYIYHGSNSMNSDQTSPKVGGSLESIFFAISTPKVHNR